MSGPGVGRFCQTVIALEPYISVKGRAPVPQSIQALTDEVRARWDPQFELITNEFVPWTLWYTAVAKSKVALVSTGGVYLSHGLNQPFDDQAAGGDPSFRELPAVSLAADMTAGAGTPDPAAAKEDINVVLPLERLRQLADAGYIGEVGPFAYSFAGRVTRPVSLLANYAPSVAYRLKRMGADVALVLAVGGVVEHQTAALVARAAELAGVPSVVLGTNQAVLEAVRAPRSVIVNGPETSPLGSPGNAGKHQHIIRAALEAAWQLEAPGATTI